MQETQVQSLAREANGNPPQYSGLGNPMDKGAQQGYSPWGRRVQLSTQSHIIGKYGYEKLKQNSPQEACSTIMLQREKSVGFFVGFFSNSLRFNSYAICCCCSASKSCLNLCHKKYKILYEFILTQGHSTLLYVVPILVDVLLKRAQGMITL